MVRKWFTSRDFNFYIFLLALVAFTCVEREPVAPPTTNTELPPAGQAHPAVAAGDLWVSQDGLASPWLDASWGANITYSSTDHVYAGASAIKVALTSAWGAVSVHYGNWYTTGIAPGSYSSLDFAVYGMTSGTTLSIFFENDAGQSFPGVSYGPVPTGVWSIVSIPMSRLDPSGLTINRVDIQDVSGSARTFYVDNLRFVGTSGGGIPPTAPATSSPTNGATSVQINPTLAWTASSGASTYRLQVATNTGFISPIKDQSNLSGSSYGLSGLAYSTTYYWRVNASNSYGTSGWSPTSNFTTQSSAPPPAPDLTVDANRMRSSYQITSQSFGSSSCAVYEGCTGTGTRRLLRFDVVVQNFGNSDLVLGNPADHPELFEWSSCHGHYHFKQFAQYRLLTADRSQLLAGRKQAFCLTDGLQYWSGSASHGYNCQYQGISLGWGDLYSRSLDCQWLDITGIPAGDYILEVEVNVGHVINEGANTRPNVVDVSISIW